MQPPLAEPVLRLSHLAQPIDSGLPIRGDRGPRAALGTPNLQVIYEDRRELGREVLAGAGVAGNRIDLVAEPPAHALVSAAHRHDAAEIVVGSRGYGRLRTPLGSVSHELLHLADRPVIIVPPAAVVA